MYGSWAFHCALRTARMPVIHEPAFGAIRTDTRVRGSLLRRSAWFGRVSRADRSVVRER